MGAAASTNPFELRTPMKHHTSTRSPGLRRYVAQPDRYAERYGNFTLTPRDYEILDLIYRYRYLEARHVRALVAGSDQQITRRLQGLFHNRFIGRYIPRQRMRMELDPGPPVVAYGLETRGARALRANTLVPGAGGDASEPIRWRKAYTRRTEWFLEHRLMVSRFRCALELATHSAPLTTLSSWSDGDETRLRVRIPGSPPRTTVIAPDAIFTLVVSGATRRFFLEVDRGTEEHSRLARKFVAYWWYLHREGTVASDDHRRRTNVLFLTTTPTRVENMLLTLRRLPKPNRASHGGRGVFWFCDSPDLLCSSDHSVLEMKWRTASRSLTTLTLC